MKRLHIVCFVAIILVCVVTFTNCETMFYRPGTLGKTQYFEAYYILNANNPLFDSMGSDDAAKFDKVEKLETDAYGRELFRYSAWAQYIIEGCDNNTYATFLVICQKTGGDFAYYYEDYCWLTKKNNSDDSTFADYSDEEFMLLKERNDWGLPLNDDKMQQVRYRNTGIEEKPNFSLLSEEICAKLELSFDEVDILFIHHLEKKNATEQFVWVNVNYMYYLCLVNPTNNAILDCKLYEGDPLQCHNAIHQFKSDHGFYDDLEDKALLLRD